MNTELLFELLNTTSVSGFEDEAISLFVEYAKKLGAETHVDSMNSAYAAIGPLDAKTTIIVEAHIDEIGFQVSYIDEHGYIYLRRNGGIDDCCIPGSVVEITLQDGSKISGVIGKKPIHLTAKEDRKDVPELDALWVDTGIDYDIIKEKVRIGDPVGFRPNLIQLANKKISSKALDDKIGVFTIMECLQKLMDVKLSSRVYFITAAQEEVGCRGAKVLGYGINPDYAICVDVEFATDVPDCPKQKYGDVRLGDGVVISKHLDSNRQLSSFAENIAGSNSIKYQLSAHVTATGGTDASVMQVSERGLKTLLMGIPCRYMHTPVEVVDLRDVESAIDLIVNLIKSL